MTLEVHAPLRGRALPLADVPDDMFAAAMVGPGLAIDPWDGPVEAVAPVDGTLAKLHPHAFVVIGAGDRGVLVHLGIDTVQLKGEGFRLLAEEGGAVTVGTPIVAWDARTVREGGRSPVCPVVALDAGPDDLDALVEAGELTPGDVVFRWHGTS